MDKDVLEQINEAVDRGDEQVKQELLNCFEEIKCFAESLTLPGGLTGEGILSSKSQPLAPDANGILRLVICLFCLRDSADYPPTIADWYMRASAWCLADAGLWDELTPE